MKRKNLFIVIGFILCFGVGFYVSKMMSNNGQIIPPQPILVVNDTFQNCYDCDTTAHCKIPLYNVIEMVKNYKLNRYNVINGQP